MIVKRTGEKSICCLNEKKGVTYITFPSLEGLPIIKHGFSTRLGGVSHGIYSSMNFREDGEETAENVRTNYKRMSDALSLELSSLVRPSLCHGNRVQRVGKKDCGKGVIRPTDLIETDGLITNDQGVTLIATFADCVPLYFVDLKHRAIGLAHSGWRGTVAKIGAEIIHKMQEEFDSNASELIVCIGPSICKTCYEVGEDTAAEFSQAFPDVTSEIIQKNSRGMYFLDLWKANEYLLKKEGILPEHLSVTDLCTCCNPELLFSHRATKGRRGNLAAFLALAE